MTGPPAKGPNYAAEAGPLGARKTGKLSSYVKVVNSVWNGSGYITRKKANQYVKLGRGEFVGEEQFRLKEDNEANKAARSRAAIVYESLRRPMTLKEQRHIAIVNPPRSRGNHAAGKRTVDQCVRFRILPRDADNGDLRQQA